MAYAWAKAAVAAICGAALALGPLFAGAAPARAGDTLRALTWESYAPPALIEAFAAETGCTIEPTYVTDNDQIIARMAAGGGGYDVVSPAADVGQLLIGMGVIAPLDQGRLSNFAAIPGALRAHPAVRSGGGLWSVPVAWGAVPLMYRTDKFETPPRSAKVLFDAQYKGKVAIQNSPTSLYLAARVMWGANAYVYDMTDAQLEAVKQSLRAQKPLLRGYWSSARELITLYADDEVWVSDTWGGYQVRALQERGIPVAEVLPEEKADGWQDVWAIVEGTDALDCAYAWLDFATGAAAQCALVRATGYAPANPGAVQACLSAEERHALHVDDPDYVGRLDFRHRPTRVEAYDAVWTEVLTRD